MTALCSWRAKGRAMNAKHLASQASCKERTARTNARIPRPCKSRRGSPRTVRSVFFAARFTRVAARPIERQGSPTKKQHEHAHLFHVRLVDSSPISAAADVHVCARPESARSRSASPVRGCRLCSLPVPVSCLYHLARRLCRVGRTALPLPRVAHCCLLAQGLQHATQQSCIAIALLRARSEAQLVSFAFALLAAPSSWASVST
ncbi:unnamed protein product [Prorocentrum cordatum]|uniref:Uncharacterized protein n=1 Tax=Prorocentrum cordatum TaxID=2364126 RepID=A0ABN9PVN8_9DINO|nr:unnamed protein product [Polarella glacialis]